MSFGDRLQEVRRNNGLTQEQFAEALQVSRQAVSRWESGRSYPEVDKILYIYLQPLRRVYRRHVRRRESRSGKRPAPTVP